VATLGLAGGALVLPALVAILPASGEQVSVTALVPGFCKFNAAPTMPASANVTPVGAFTPTASALNITTPTNGAGFMQSWLFTLTMNGTCNKVSDVRLTTQNGGLKDLSGHGPGAPPPGFIKRFDYTASVSFDGAPPALLLPTDGTPGASSIPTLNLTTGPYTGTATLHVNGVPNLTAPLLAGNYLDILTVSLIPQ
jgi:hypothetical protein